MVNHLPRYTALELKLDALLSDGLKHSYPEIREMVTEHYDDDHLDKSNIRGAIQRLRVKMRRLEPQCEIITVFVGYAAHWRKFRRIDGD